MSDVCAADGCQQPRRKRSSYCSQRCRDADNPHSVGEILDPEAER